MVVIHDLSEVPAGFGPAAVALGNFDGIHLGHRSLLSRMVNHARNVGVPSVVLTFHPHPAEVLHPGLQLERLTTTDEKLAVIESLGVDQVLVQKFDRALASLSPQHFFDRFLRGGLRAQSVFVGFNFHFGQGRSGNPETLRQLCAGAGSTLHVEPPFEREGIRVSSTAIRGALKEGALDRANLWLGRPYDLAGAVVRGAGRGRQLGVPTANLRVPPGKCLPANGVYVTRTHWQRQAFPSVTNLGVRPTVSRPDEGLSVECHLLDFQRDLYGEQVRLEFLARLREEKRFSGLDELKSQIALDIGAARKYFGSPS